MKNGSRTGASGTGICGCAPELSMGACGAGIGSSPVRCVPVCFPMFPISRGGGVLRRRGGSAARGRVPQHRTTGGFPTAEVRGARPRDIPPNCVAQRPPCSREENGCASGTTRPVIVGWRRDQPRRAGQLLRGRSVRCRMSGFVRECWRGVREFRSVPPSCGGMHLLIHRPQARPLTRRAVRGGRLGLHQGTLGLKSGNRAG